MPPNNDIILREGGRRGSKKGKKLRAHYMDGPQLVGRHPLKLGEGFICKLVYVHTIHNSNSGNIFLCLIFHKFNFKTDTLVVCPAFIEPIKTLK